VPFRLQTARRQAIRLVLRAQVDLRLLAFGARAGIPLRSFEVS
jgi:hypothetical protein